MRRKIDFLIIWLFIFVPTLARSNETILKLQQQGLLSKGNITIESVKKGGKSSKEVLLVTDPEKGDLAIKVFDNLGKYQNEVDEFKISGSIAHQVQTLNTEHKKIPIITSIISSVKLDTTGIIILPQAKGDELQVIIDNLNKMNDEDIKHIFNNIGQQTSNLDALLVEKHERKILIHPDSHPDNFIYNRDENKFYWIDTANITYKIYGDKCTLNAFYRFIAAIARGILRTEISYDEHLNHIDIINGNDQHQITKLVNTIEKRLLALKSLFTGYDKDNTNVIAECLPSYKILIENDLFKTEDKISTRMTIAQFIKKLNEKLLQLQLKPVEL
jgi:hypothetical protein